MNLLIVDDEELTREGLINSIDWKNLGIDNIYQADDGFNAIIAAKKHKPEIILSDVRMPRLDGIEMAKKLREIIPDCSIIFMSGYSDKEYLKAAIKLKAVSYVEKPIDTAEIEDAVKEAIEEYNTCILNKTSIDIKLHDEKTKLALRLIYPNTCNENYIPLFQKTGYNIKSSTSFTTLVLKLADLNNMHPDSELEDILMYFNSLACKYKLSYIYGLKQDNHIIFHLFSEKCSHENIFRFAKGIASLMSVKYKFFISIGKTVSSPDKLFNSYNQAVILMHSSFFYTYNSVLTDADETLYNQTPNFADIIESYTELLSQQNRGECIKLLTQLKDSLVSNRHVLVNTVKDAYYKLFLALNSSAESFHVPIKSSEIFENILDYITQCNNIFDLHKLLCDQTCEFFNSIDLDERENSTVFLIKDYINKNYKNESLSIKDISEHVFLSSSYICTIFKSETGKTLNQYITEFRIEKAKKLLMDSRYKITDISAKVGYNDGNYFGKSFKKLVGMSPSEYRDKYMGGSL